MTSSKKRISEAKKILESLKLGLPPRHGVRRYSVGYDTLLAEIEREYLAVTRPGLIRFVSGTWGSGKTHFFRLLRELFLEHDWLVSSVELDTNTTALNKFESIFAKIVSNIESRNTAQRQSDQQPEMYKFGQILQETLCYLATGTRTGEVQKLSDDQIRKVCTKLAQNGSVDLDFKKMVRHYWETFSLTEFQDPDSAYSYDRRGEILQWFGGEGDLKKYQREFGVTKIVNRANARSMLSSLAGFVRFAEYNGLVILFDETAQSMSTLRKSQRKEAHDNLLALINGIDHDNQKGLFLIYASTPDFYEGREHSIERYPALRGRIGKVPKHPPRASDRIWNIDEISLDLADFENEAIKIREIYTEAYPENQNPIPDESSFKCVVQELYDKHRFSHVAVGFWRMLVTYLIEYLDDHRSGKARSLEERYDDIMETLREA